MIKHRLKNFISTNEHYFNSIALNDSQVVLLTYCIANGNIYRILNGYDSCGYICGRKNTHIENESNCSQNDKETTPFLIVRPLTINADGESEPIGVDRYCSDNCISAG